MNKLSEMGKTTSYQQKWRTISRNTQPKSGNRKIISRKVQTNSRKGQTISKKGQTISKQGKTNNATNECTEQIYIVTND